MTTPDSTDLSKHHRFPSEIISHAVWLYCRFPLSHRDVEELLFVRGVIVSYETIRKWCRKFGQPYANQLRRRCPRPGDQWHLDEVFITINKGRGLTGVDSRSNGLSKFVAIAEESTFPVGRIRARYLTVRLPNAG